MPIQFLLFLQYILKYTNVSLFYFCYQNEFEHLCEYETYERHKWAKTTPYLTKYVFFIWVTFSLCLSVQGVLECCNECVFESFFIIL